MWTVISFQSLLLPLPPSPSLSLLHHNHCLILPLLPYNRLSKGSHKAHVFTEITDNHTFGVCAKCTRLNISQDDTMCPGCGHALGSRGHYFEVNCGVDGKPCPRVPDSDVPPFIVFRCGFEAKLGCRIQGTGPVIVTSVLDPVMVGSMPIGCLVSEHSGGVIDSNMDYSTGSMRGGGASSSDNNNSSSSSSSVYVSPVVTAVSSHTLPTATATTMRPVVGTVLSMAQPTTTTTVSLSTITPASVYSGVSVLALDIAGLIPFPTTTPLISIPTTSVHAACLPGGLPEANGQSPEEKERERRPRVGDILLAVNGVSVEHMDFAQVTQGGGRERRGML